VFGGGQASFALGWAAEFASVQQEEGCDDSSCHPAPPLSRDPIPRIRRYLPPSHSPSRGRRRAISSTCSSTSLLAIGETAAAIRPHSPYRYISAVPPDRRPSRTPSCIN